MNVRAISVVAAFLLLMGSSNGLSQSSRSANQEAEQIDAAIKRYHAAAATVSLGESKAAVLSKLPDQTHLGNNAKAPESLINGNDRIEIFFFRSERIPDGRTTDDEVVPYVFINGKLAAIGWSALGGPKTVGDPDAQRKSLGTMLQMLGIMNNMSPPTTPPQSPSVGVGSYGSAFQSTTNFCFITCSRSGTSSALCMERCKTK